MAKPKVFRGYSASRNNANQSSTAGDSYYTPNAKGVRNAGGSGLNARRAPRGYRMMTTKGQKVRYKEDKGKGKQYGDQVLVSRSQQYRAIRTSLGLTSG